ncbi:hypothetical protein [Janthinobacterium fluminis]|uniref:Uncharacterized protein n=1 Tax=Janthinobacterium fluminis TaxID=2987524 RepID=A0ABT5JZG8_9BURK|nr:hypothetical protein [Janthinobacterium fluminis]MDC8756882.1 hypothetical protein [Janthinobacterium fluminis]
MANDIDRRARAPEAVAGGEDAAMPYEPDDAGFAATAPVDAARRRHERALLAIDGVEGVATGRTALGNDAIILYLRDATVQSRVPSQIEGFPVQTTVTGPINAGRRR